MTSRFGRNMTVAIWLWGCGGPGGGEGGEGGAERELAALARERILVATGLIVPAVTVIRTDDDLCLAGVAGCDVIAAPLWLSGEELEAVVVHESVHVLLGSPRHLPSPGRGLMLPLSPAFRWLGLTVDDLDWVCDELATVSPCTRFAPEEAL